MSSPPPRTAAPTCRLWDGMQAPPLPELPHFRYKQKSGSNRSEPIRPNSSSEARPFTLAAYRKYTCFGGVHFGVKDIDKTALVRH